MFNVGAFNWFFLIVYTLESEKNFNIAYIV